MVTRLNNNLEKSLFVLVREIVVYDFDIDAIFRNKQQKWQEIGGMEYETDVALQFRIDLATEGAIDNEMAPLLYMSSQI